MVDSEIPEHYEVLQVSPRADQETIQRVFRHLAKRFHPDNGESGDDTRFRQLMESYQILSDPEQRARYDIQYAERVQARWRIFNQETTLNDVAADRTIRSALLSILYAARRNNSDQAGVGELELERVLECPEVHMRFHIWYLKENGWIRRLDNGTLAITASGVDFVLDLGAPLQQGMHLLKAPNKKASATPRQRAR